MSRKIKIDLNIISRFFYVLFCLAWCIGDYNNNYNDEYKYVVLLVHVMILLIIFIKKVCILKNKKVNFLYELRQIFIVMLTFSIISIIYQIVLMDFKTYFIKEIFYMFMPCLYVFLLINTDEKKDKSFYFNSTLIIFSIFFFIEFKDVLNINNISKISFVDSYSPFESNIPFAGVFLVLYTYFLINKNKKRAILSFLLCFLSFKRIHVIYILLLPIIYILFKNKSTVSKKILNFTKILFIFSPVLIKFIFSDYFSDLFYSMFHINFDQFVMSRFSLINYVLNLDFKNYGLATTYYITPPSSQIYDMSGNGTQFNMHCDLLRIYIEISIVGLAVFVNNYFNITKNNVFKYALMLTYFIIMFSSHATNSFYTWILIYMFFAMFNNKEKLENGKD